MTNNNFGEWLERKYIEWIAKTGRRRTMAEFSDWLGIPRPLMSRYLNGSRKPKRSKADILAERFGSEVYELLGFRSPENLLRALQTHWDRLNDRERAQVEQIVDRLESEQ